MTAKGLAQALGQPQWSNTLRIATGRHDEPTRRAVATAVEKSLTGAGVEVRSVESVGLRETATGGHLEPILVILLATALPMGLIGCIGLASTMSANVLDRTRAPRRYAASSSPKGSSSPSRAAWWRPFPHSGSLRP